MSKHVVISGGSGFIGAYCAVRFLDKGFRVTTVSRSAPKLPSPYATHKNLNVVLSSAIELHKLSVEPASLFLHTAAQTTFRNRADDEMACETNNRAVFSICDFIEKNRIDRVIALSSISVYGSWENSPLTEVTPLHKPDVYGLTKCLGDLLLEKHSPAKETLILRLPGVLGENCNPIWLSKIMAQAKQHSPIQLINPDRAYNSLSDVADIFEFLRSRHQKNEFKKGTFLFAASDPIPVRQVAKIITDFFKSQSEVSSTDNISKPSPLIDIQRLKDELHFTPSATTTIINRHLNNTHTNKG